jgi:hypothetical protein
VDVAARLLLDDLVVVGRLKERRVEEVVPVREHALAGVDTPFPFVS